MTLLLLLGLFIQATAQQPPGTLDDAVSMLALTSKTEIEVRPKWKGCNHCCIDSDNYAPCLDVDACAAKGPKNGKYAFVLSHWLPLRNDRHLTNIEAMKKQAKANGADLLMLMLQKHIDETSSFFRKQLESHGFRFVPVAWDLPPKMKFTAPNWTLGMERGWCGPMDLIRLHLFNITGYDAVVYYDSDIELQGDVMPALRCAATGKLLTSTGTISPINVGFIATRPDERMLKASVKFAQVADFDYDAGGWGEGGFQPWPMKFIGAECGQGFIHTLFYKAKTNKLAQLSLKSAGLKPEDIHTGQLDRCIWNYHGQDSCGAAPEKFDCSLVRVHHKPKKPQAGSCTKFRDVNKTKKH